MKRYLVLALLLVIMVAAISGTNAAYSRQIALQPDVIEAASPTPLPTPTPLPIPTSGPTPTPTSKPWSGEFELVVSYDGAAWRSAGDAERLLGNMRFRLHNNTGTGTLPAINAVKWQMSFSANLNMGDTFNMLINKQAANQYTLTSVPHKSAPEASIVSDMGGGVSTYDLTRKVNGVKTRTTNPTLHELIFSNVRLSIATSNNGPLVMLEPHRVRIRYIPPPPLIDWISEWDKGVIYPPGWALFH